jgi:hypothetical protein
MLPLHYYEMEIFFNVGDILLTIYVVIEVPIGNQL